MQTAIERRRSRFLKALAAADSTQAAWARENGISKVHLSYVLRGMRESATLTRKIDAYVQQWLEALADSAVA